MEEINFNLTDSLKKYKPIDSVEAEHLKKIIAFINSNNNQFSRTNLLGHIVGSAYLFNEDFSKVLLTHHKFLNRWLQFGGHSDGEKNTLSVAMRETFEESGISNIKPVNGEIFDVDAHIIPENKKKNEPEHYHYDIRFLLTTSQKNYIVSDESTELGWFTIEEFKKIDQTESGKRFVKKWQQLIQNKTISRECNK